MTKKKYDYRLISLEANDKGVLEPGKQTDLDDLERDPSGLLVRDLDGDDDRDLLIALITMHRDAGMRDTALEFAHRFVEVSPRDPVARQLLGELEDGVR